MRHVCNMHHIAPTVAEGQGQRVLPGAGGAGTGRCGSIYPADTLAVCQLLTMTPHFLVSRRPSWSPGRYWGRPGYGSSLQPSHLVVYLSHGNIAMTQRLCLDATDRKARCRAAYTHFYTL